MSKILLTKALAALGYELCRLGVSEQADDVAGLNYKDAQLKRAIGASGQLSIAEARLLGELVAQSDPTRPIIEIGTLFGWSSLVMSLFKQRDQRLITVDNYSWNPLGMSPEAHFRATSARLAPLAESENVQLVKQDKNEFYRNYDGPAPALFFCDADHSYEATLADLKWAISVDASIICGDDMEPPHEGVMRAVNELGGARRKADGLFVLRQ